MSKRSEESEIGLLQLDGGSHPAWQQRSDSKDWRSHLGNTRLRVAAGCLALFGLLYAVLPLSGSRSSSFNPVKIPLPLNTSEIASLSKLTVEDLAYQRSFTDAECDYLFSDLYKESERAKQFWKAKGGITQKLVDDAQPVSNARIIIKDGQVC